MDTQSTFDAYLSAGDVTLGARDVELLRAIDREGSLNNAAETLSRSYAHAQRRIVELEEAFGSLVERRRGGAGGGGSELTDNARDLLAAFARTQSSFEGVADIAETVLSGDIVDRDGELVTVETGAGHVRALVPDGSGAVELSIRADAVTLTDPEDTPVPEHTSARNRFVGDQDFGILQQRPRDRHALLLATREIAAVGGGVFGHTDTLKACHRPLTKVIRRKSR